MRRGAVIASAGASDYPLWWRYQPRGESYFETPYWDGYSQARLAEGLKADRVGENPARTLFLSPEVSKWKR